MPHMKGAADNVTVRKAVEFLHIELATLADGKTSVSVMAITVDDEEPQLLNQEIATEQVGSLDEALTLIGTLARTVM